MSFLYLKPQDTIALVCTGTPCTKGELDDLSHYLNKNYHLKTCYREDTYKKIAPNVRAEIFYNYLTNDSIKMIWSVRGGEGSADIIPFLEKYASKIKQLPPKILMGFSDFTPLLIYFSEKFAWPTIHGPGARQFSQRRVDLVSEKITMDWLENKGSSLALPFLKPLNPLAYSNFKIRAPLTGGNLTLVHLGIGEVWQCQPQNKILLLEEVNEKPYRVIRTLKHLQRVHFFENVKAVILAGFDFPDCSFQENQEIKRSFEPYFQQFAWDCHCPVLYCDSIGHGEINYPLTLGAFATLALGRRPSLKQSRKEE